MNTPYSYLVLYVQNVQKLATHQNAHTATLAASHSSCHSTGILQLL